MNSLAILFIIAAMYIHQGIAVRIPASSPLMWGRERLTQPFYKGKVVGKEDDNTIVYFDAMEGGVENEFAITNDEDFSKKLVMDVNPYPYMIFVGSNVMTSFENTCEVSKCRYNAYVTSYRHFWGVGYSYSLSAWWDEKERKAKPYWVQMLLTPFTTSDLNLIRPVVRRRTSLCNYFNPDCRKKEDCILIDDLLPLIGCKGAKTPAPTSKPPTTLLPTTEPTITPTQASTPTPEPPTLPPTLPPTTAPPHPPTLPPTLPPTTVPPTAPPHPPTQLQTLPPAKTSLPHPPTPPLATDLPISTETPITDDPDLEEINEVLEQEEEEEFDLNRLWTIVIPVAAVGCTVLVAVLVCVVRRRISKATTSRDEESQVTKTERRKKRRRRRDQRSRRKDRDHGVEDAEDAED